MIDQEKYRKLQDRVSRIPQKEQKFSKSHKIGVYLLEAENQVNWAEEDLELLVSKAGLDPAIPEEARLLIKMLKDAQIDWTKERMSRRPAMKLWLEAMPAGYDLCSRLFHIFRHAYRHDQQVLMRLKYRARKNYHEAMIMNLEIFGTIGNNKPEPLKAIDFDFDLLDESFRLSHKLGNLLALQKAEKKAGYRKKEFRDQAFTALKKAIDEIRICGRFLFRGNKERLIGYRSESLRQRNSRRVRKSSAAIEPRSAVDSAPDEVPTEIIPEDIAPGVSTDVAADVVVDVTAQPTSDLPEKAAKEQRAAKKRKNKKRRR